MGSHISSGTSIFQRMAGSYIEWEIKDYIATEEGFKALLESEKHMASIKADQLEEKVTSNSIKWVEGLYKGEKDGEPVYIPHPKDGRPDEKRPSKPEDLTICHKDLSKLSFKKIEGKGSRKQVNKFLEGNNTLVYHKLGSISSWKACFIATNQRNEIISAIVLHHYHPSTNGEEIAITRLANHEVAPKNTSSWMISRARKWAERAGYQKIVSYAGVDENEGVCYRAAGFEQEGPTEQVSGTEWKNPDTSEKWVKKKFSYDLNPEKYEDKSSEWAIETVTEDVLEPGRSEGLVPG